MANLLWATENFWWHVHARTELDTNGHAWYRMKCKELKILVMSDQKSFLKSTWSHTHAQTLPRRSFLASQKWSIQNSDNASTCGACKCKPMDSPPCCNFWQQWKEELRQCTWESNLLVFHTKTLIIRWFTSFVTRKTSNDVVSLQAHHRQLMHYMTQNNLLCIKNLLDLCTTHGWRNITWDFTHYHIHYLS